MAWLISSARSRINALVLQLLEAALLFDPKTAQAKAGYQHKPGKARRLQA